MKKYLMGMCYISMAYSMEKTELREKTEPRYSTATWMHALNGYIGNEPLNKLWIPGTHNSATDKIDYTSCIVPKGHISEKFEKLKSLGIGYIINTSLVPYSKTQDRSIYEQLQDGARYLDLRVTWRDDQDEKGLWTYNDFYSQPFSKVLEQINDFTDAYHTEVLIMQIRGFQNMEDYHHTTIINNLKKHLKHKIIHKEINFATTTLNDIYKNPERILIVYNHLEFSRKYKLLPTSSAQTLMEESNNLTKLRLVTDFSLMYRDHMKSLFVMNPELKPLNIPIKGVKQVIEQSKDINLKELATHINFLLSRSWLGEWKKDGFYPNIIATQFANQDLNKKIINQNLTTY